MPDDVLALLPKNGGVVHVNFIHSFIAPQAMAWQEKRTAALREIKGRLDTDDGVKKAITEWEKANPEPRGTIADVADHIDHIR
ncbi:membrane dipeptidase, partial [Enterococcus faecium]